MKSQPQEEKNKKVVPRPDDNQIGWEYPRGFSPELEKPDSSPPPEPS
jgi:hypothetical protein